MIWLGGQVKPNEFGIDVYDKLPYPGGMMVFAIPRSRISFSEVVEGWKDLEQNFSVEFYLKTKVAVGESHDDLEYLS